MNTLIINGKRLTNFSQTHPGVLFIIFTILVAIAAGLIFIQTIILPRDSSAPPPLLSTQAVNVNRSARDKIFRDIDQRVAGVAATLTTPVKDPF